MPAARPVVSNNNREAPVKRHGLFHFLAWNGGLRPDPELRVIFDTSNPHPSRVGKLIRKSGMSLDRAREACIAEGFLQDHECREHEPTINDLLELIAAEARGQKQYRSHEAVDAWELSRARWPKCSTAPSGKAKRRTKAHRKRQRRHMVRRATGPKCGHPRDQLQRNTNYQYFCGVCGKPVRLWELGLGPSQRDQKTSREWRKRWIKPLSRLAATHAHPHDRQAHDRTASSNDGAANVAHLSHD
jgi:hypothetical protein